MPRFNGEELTEQSMQQAREWFAANAQTCIDDAVAGLVLVNDIRTYIKWQQILKDDTLAGSYDHTLTFLQKAYWIQTGECVALLP
jgi:DNA-binding transcriptional regulator YdaS (Cro superfamily)